MKVRFTTRLEVEFDGKPASTVIGELKRRGFWWDGRGRVWWLARPVHVRFVRQEPISQDGTEWAMAYLRELGMTAADENEANRAADAYGHRMGERGMEIACGIA